MTRRAGREDGAVALLSCMLAVVVAIAAAMAVAAGSAGLVSASQLQATADAAALAVLSGSSLAGGDGTPDVDAGGAVAREGGAELVGVDLEGWPLSTLVEVRRGGGVARGALRTDGLLRGVHPLDRTEQTATSAARLVDPG